MEENLSYILTSYNTSSYSSPIDLILSTKFRQQAICEESKKTIKEYITSQEPDIHIYCMCGGYKQPNCVSSPGVDTADFFHIGMMCKRGQTLAEMTQKKIHIHRRFHVGFIQYANFFSSEDIAQYQKEFSFLLVYFQSLFPSLCLDIVYPWELSEAYTRYCEVLNIIQNDPSPYLITSEDYQKAYRNINWGNVGNYTEKKKQTITAQAYRIDKYFLDNDPFIQKHAHSDKITIYWRKFKHNNKLVYRSIEDCSIQFWAGSGGIINHNGKKRPWIYANSFLEGKNIKKNTYRIDHNNTFLDIPLIEYVS